jgi:hypothetical protein
MSTSVVNSSGKRIVRASEPFYVKVGYAESKMYEFTAAELSYSQFFVLSLQMEAAKSEEDTNFRAELFTRPIMDVIRHEDKGRVDRVHEACIKTPAFFGVNSIGTKENPIVLTTDNYVAYVDAKTGEIESRKKITDAAIEIVHSWFVAHRVNDIDSISYLTAQPININNHSQLKFRNDIDTKFFADFGRMLKTLMQNNDAANEASGDAKKMARNKVLWLQDLLECCYETLNIEPLADKIMAWAAVLCNSLPDEILQYAKVNEVEAVQGSLNTKGTIESKLDEPEY